MTIAELLSDSDFCSAIHNADKTEITLRDKRGDFEVAAIHYEGNELIIDIGQPVL